MKRKVQNPARLILFFSSCFIITLLLAVMIRFLELRIGELRLIPGPPVTKLPEFIAALRWALVPALYISILQSLSYCSRRNISMVLSVPGLLALSLGALLGFSWGVERLRELPPLPAPAPLTAPGEKGLILSRGGASMILLKGPEDLRGPRVVSLPGQPLIYQEQPRGPDNTTIPLPPLPFRDETTPVLTSLFIDFSLSAQNLEDLQREGLPVLALYAASLILLLVSLRFVLDIGNWPMASLFLGALVFRGILALETFLNTGETQKLLTSFLGERAPPFPFALSPLIFCTLGLLIFLYTALIHLVKPRRAGDD